MERVAHLPEWTPRHFAPESVKIAVTNAGQRLQVSHTQVSPPYQPPSHPAALRTYSILATPCTCCSSTLLARPVRLSTLIDVALRLRTSSPMHLYSSPCTAIGPRNGSTVGASSSLRAANATDTAVAGVEVEAAVARRTAAAPGVRDLRGVEDVGAGGTGRGCGGIGQGADGARCVVDLWFCWRRALGVFLRRWRVGGC